MLKVKIKRLPHAKDIDLPFYATQLSAGVDLRAAVDDRVVMKPGERKVIPTGIVIELPEGYEGQVRPRSGLALKKGVTVLNSPGTIDADYRGEVKVILINLGNDIVEIKRGDRIAQLVVAPVIKIEIEETQELTETIRGKGGFGSTGI